MEISRMKIVKHIFNNLLKDRGSDSGGSMEPLDF